MTAPAWMPLYVADYLADTGHLTCTAHGAYLLLLMHYWRHGNLPQDETQLARIARLSPEDWPTVREVIRPLFQDGWQHKRVNAELSKVSDISNKRRDAANRRYSKSSAIAEQKDTQSQSQSHIKKDSCALPRTLHEAHFEDFWRAYPKRAGANPKAPARKLFLAACKAGVDSDAITGGARRCAAKDSDKIGTPYIPQAVKWLRDKRWEDYPEETEHVNGFANIGFYAEFGSQELEAWDAYKRRTEGKGLPRDKRGGWIVPARWPPDAQFIA